MAGATTSPDAASDSRAVFPCTIHHNGRLGGLWTLFAESSQARNEWKSKLDEAIGLRKVVQESNKVFEIETLSADTFLVPSMMPSGSSQSWNQENAYTGKVTCSVPFSKSDHPCREPFAHLAYLQTLPMAAAWLLSDVQRACG